MSLILDGTSGLSDVDGTTAAPAIRGTDINTGIFFPAADTIAFSKGGVEAMRINASGEVFIGGTTQGRETNLSVDGTYQDPTGVWAQVGIYSTDTQTSNKGGTIGFGGQDGSIAKQQFAAIKGAKENSTSANYAGYMAFFTRPNGDVTTERARIDSNGKFLVGTINSVAAAGDARFQVAQGNTNWIHFVNNTNTSGGVYGSLIYFSYAPNNTGSGFFACGDTSAERLRIYANGGIANYSANNVNLSDRREKTNFAPAKSYLETICAIPVQTFNYIDQNLEEDGGLTLGVVAQDVQAVAPEMVMESNWGTEKEPKMRLSVYQTDLQYALMKAIQEQQTLITALTARITALEGTAA